MPVFKLATRIAALTLLATVQGNDLAYAADRPPNILYIVADDLGWKDVEMRSGLVAPAIRPVIRSDMVCRCGPAPLEQQRRH